MPSCDLQGSPNTVRLRVTLASMFVVALCAAVLVPVTAVGATSQPAALDVSRYGGADRYATSLMVADAVAAHAGGTLDAVVMVSGRSWTDAVVAAPLAGSLGAPVLATPSGQLRPDAQAFLQQAGVSRVLIVGADNGSDGVGSGVESALTGMGIDIERVTRADQYATSIAVAERVGAPGDMGAFGRTAIIASGEVFADALVAGAFAARGRHPVLLTAPERLDGGVAAYLQEADVSHVVLMGGTSALSSVVESSVRALGVGVTRLAGATRYDTAVKAAEFVTGRYGGDCFTDRRVGLARARVPFDSFSAGPLLGRLCTPLLLSDPSSIPDDTAVYLDRIRRTASERADQIVDVRVFGGNAAVSSASIDAYVRSDPVEGSHSTARPDAACDVEVGNEPSGLLSGRYARKPAWSPDCTRIAYQDDEQAIWTANPDGSDPVQVTGGFTRGEEDDSHSWSPDGSKIAFSRYSGEFMHGEPVRHIFVVNADGTGEVQLTNATATDDAPSWSPDGRRIAFGRHNLATTPRQYSYNVRDEYIVVIDADGRNETALTRGGSIEQSPDWSPDGNYIAFASDSDLWVMRADASYPRPVSIVGSRAAGYSWSPDGRAIAYVSYRFLEGDRVEEAVRTTNLDGSAIGDVASYVGSLDSFTVVRSPDWSPDGQSILFERNSNQGTQARAFVAPVPEPRAAPIAHDCRPTAGPPGGVGFPQQSYVSSTVGRLRIALLFADFPDAQATHGTRAEAAMGNLEDLEAYLEAMSYGRLDVQLVPHHQWLTVSQPVDHYTIVIDQVSSTVVPEVIHLADPAFDFSDIDAVLTVLPSSHFFGGFASGFAEADGSTMGIAAANTWLKEEPTAPDSWGGVAVHELIHVLGLPDLYDYGIRGFSGVSTRLIQAPTGHEWRPVQVGRMGLSARYPARSGDPAIREHGEMLGWSRWQLGWLTASQFECVNTPEAVVKLAPLARPGTGTAVAAVPVSHDVIIVMESRRRIGYDNATGASVLVYTVDPTLRGGRRPIKFATDDGNGSLTQSPFLRVGESVRVAGRTITVTADDGDNHTVTIVKSG